MAVIQKYHESLLVIIIHIFSNHFAINLFHNINKLWNHNHTVHASERNQNKNRTMKAILKAINYFRKNLNLRILIKALIQSVFIACQADGYRNIIETKRGLKLVSLP